MKQNVAETKQNGTIRWPLFSVALLLITVVLIVSTVLWMGKAQTASEETINDLGKFYLEEITERNTGSITSELEKRTTQMERALTVLEADDLEDEASVRRFLYLVQQINGLDMFALVDDEGMVYTADSTFSGISRFSFLSEQITGTQIHMVKSYGTNTMIIIAMPVTLESGTGIHAVSCFTGLNMESIISARQLQNTENKTYCRLFTREGENLLRITGEYPDGKNLFDTFAEVAEFAPGYSLEMLKADWDSGNEGYTVYHTASAGNTYLYYKPVPGTDMILTSLMRESNINSVVETGTRQTLRSSIVYLTVVVNALILLILMMLWMIRNGRRNQQENELLKIIGALSNDYSDIFLMEPLLDRCSTIKAGGQVIEESDRVVRPYRTTWEQYVQKYLVKEDAAVLLEAVSAQELSEKLKDAAECSLDFRTDRDGELHYYQIKFVKIASDEDKLIVGFRNIDAQMQAEQERQQVLQDALTAAQHASRAKTAFLNNMSHDIRTPMNAIIGFTTLAIANIDKTDKVRDYLSKIIASGNHLLSLINDVLDMSRIESGKIHLEEKEASLSDILHDLKTIVGGQIQAKQLELYMDTMDVTDEDVYCDRTRLNQVLLNLLSNAIKFTPPGGTISVRVAQIHSAPQGKGLYEFRVRDTGIGMSKDFVKRIFEPFERERSSTVSRIQGTGLGMAISKNIIDMMGGTISVQTEEGKGTEFTIRLPLRLQSVQRSEEMIRELMGLRALVVDDDFNTCDSAAKMLVQVGMRSEWTMSGTEAVLRAKQAMEMDDAFHAYIIDWCLPDMNGIEVTRKIRALGDNTPIIILTAYNWDEIEEEAREAGVTAFCSKPMFLSDLRESLFAALGTPTAKNDRILPSGSETVELEGRHLLLAEDNALNREIAEEILGAYGFRIDSVQNGEEAVQAIASAAPDEYDLVLMDIQMPIMDGYEATRCIRALPDPVQSAVPIIAMTANAFDEDRKAAAESGMDGFLSKPIQIKEVIQTLKSVLAEK